jgi:hypothetical protein
MAKLYSGDRRPLADSRPWDAMMGDIWLPAAVVALAWLLAAANCKPHARPYAQIGALGTAILLMTASLMRLQPTKTQRP